MKRTLAILICILFSALAYGRDVGTIGVGAPTKEDVALAKAHGLKLGGSYSTNREILIRSSWKGSLETQTSSPAFKEHPEIYCGSGYDAICQASFSKGDKSLVITIDQNKKNLPVVHVNEE